MITPKTPMNSEYSIWLLPTKAQEKSLTETITRLSSSFAGIVFAPHITIQGDLCCPLDDLTALLARTAAGIAVQKWRVLRAESSDHFFRCLYLRFERDPTFDLLQKEARTLTGTDDGLSPYPHLSLAYGQAQQDALEQCDILSAEFTGQVLTFDRIAICRSSKNTPIADWQCLADFPFAKAMK